ncbi:MAG: outer membrane lipoprotein-sorting protein [Desulfovermiculus sp.]|nr:outer membrane lipoprotein-sorting protein [Desulfovermiculus sp.]
MAPDMFRKGLSLGLLIIIMILPRPGQTQDAGETVRSAWDHFRGQASRSKVIMTIHRPSWERTMTMKGWTKGEAMSLIRILAPPKDKGNGTLKKGSEMWTYNPKINRVIKLPPSMMAQSWMGSDFSNNDLVKSDSILTDYSHEIEGQTTHQDKTVFIIRSVPKPLAPVVWGMQVLHIREDHIVLSQEFFDEDLQPVKIMTTSDLEVIDGRLFPTKWVMRKSDFQDEYTELVHEQIEFLDDLPDRLFTLGVLRNPSGDPR